MALGIQSEASARLPTGIDAFLRLLFNPQGYYCDVPVTDEGGEWSPVHEAWSRSGSWQTSKWEGGMNESNLHRNERDPKTV